MTDSTAGLSSTAGARGIAERSCAIGSSSHATLPLGCSSALAMLAHELRGDLHSLMLSATRLSQCIRAHAPAGLDANWLEEKVKHQIEVLHRAEKRIHLVLAAYGAGDEAETHDQRVDLCGIVRDALNMEQECLGLECRFVVEAPEPVLGRWDRAQLLLAVANLLNNAAKYGLGRPIEIRLFVRDEAAVICVRDHGIGLRADDIPLLFRPFGRTEASQSFEGVGFGLWFARSVAVAHGGDLIASGLPSGGACFSMSLPWHESDGGRSQTGR